RPGPMCLLCIAPRIHSGRPHELPIADLDRLMPSFTRLCTHRRLPRLVALLVVCSWAVAPASAQDVTEVTLKGAFLFNFVRFATWPADALPASPTLSACIVGDHAVGDAFTRVVAGRPLDGRTIVVSILD